MSTLEEMRAKTRAKGKDPKVIKKVWIAPRPEDFADGDVLSFDQTLGKTGWVALWNGDESATGVAGLTIGDGGLWTPKESTLTGFEQTFARAEEFGSWVHATVGLWARIVEVVLHEMPAVQGHRVESSLMAAREIRRACAYHSVPVRSINRQAAYATIVGDRHAPKREMKTAVERIVPESRRTTDRWNQDVTDSSGIALKYLYDKKQERA